MPTLLDISCLSFCSVVSSLHSVSPDQLVAYVELPPSFRMDMEVSSVSLASTGSVPLNLFALEDESNGFQWITISTTDTLALQIGYSNGDTYLTPVPNLEVDYATAWTTISMIYDVDRQELCIWSSATPTPYCHDVSGYLPGDTGSVQFKVMLSEGGSSSCGGLVRSLTFRSKLLLYSV